MRGIAWICCLAGLLPVPQPLTAQEPEVLYERELTPDELDWGTIDYKDLWSWKRSVDEARNQYRDPERVDDLQYRGIFKVELVYPEGTDGQPPRIREYAAGSKGYFWARERSERTWGSVAAPLITLGQDKDGFKFRKRELWFVGSRQGYHTIYFEKPGEVGVAHEEFEAPNGERVDASIYKAIERQIPLHEFLRGVVKGEYRVVETQIGPVLIQDHDPRRGAPVSRAAWTSGDDLAIYVAASTVDPIELVKLYGDKFPSSLPHDLTLDKAAWAREEMELTIARLKSDIDKTHLRDDRTAGNLSRLRDYVYVSVFPPGAPNLRLPPQPDQKREVLDTIVKWWEENRENTYWNEEYGLLVARGQTPAEVAEANRMKAEAEQQALRDAFLAIPPQLPTPEHPELLYERELTEKERTTEAIGQSESPINQGYLEIVRQYYKNPQTLAEVPEDIFKVELFYRDTEKGIQAFHRLHAVGYWGREWARSEKLQEWRQEATSQIILGEDKDGFKFRGKSLWLRDGDKIYQEQYGEIGYAYEEFEAPNGGRVVAEIYKGIKRPIPLHEFLHGVIRGNYRLVQTDIGPVLVRRKNERGIFQFQLAGVAWTSGDDIAVYVGGENVDPMDLVKLYGDKLPSSLPPDLKIDKTEWGREEVELGLERLRAALAEGAITRQYSIGERLRKNVYIPPWEALLKQRAELKRPNGQFSPEQRQEHLQETINVINGWWRENRENTYWDEHGLAQSGPDANVQMLVARGQTPKDVAEPAREKPDAEEQARRDALLGPPMTPGQVAEAKARLIAHFEQGMAEDAKKNAAIRGEQLGGARVKWAKVREGEWRHEFPSFNNGPLIVVTYTGPEIEQTYDRERPLRGVFQMRQENPDSRVLSNTAEYFYDRLEGAWKRRALGRTGPDAEVQMLDAKDQTSQDVAEAARQKAAAEEQARRDAILDSPMTAEQIAGAKDELIAQFERQQAGRAKQDASSRGEYLGGERVSWQRVREGQWTYEFPSAGNGPLIVDTYTGPEIEQTAEREYPLRGVFLLQRDDPRHGTNRFRKEFVYQRLGDTWRPGGSRGR